MPLPVSKYVSRVALLSLAATLLSPLPQAHAQQRSLGLDVSSWQTEISANSWSEIHNTNNRDFVFIRSSRGGTTGFYNQNDPGNNLNRNTQSQRYDDPYFVQNITRATNAGLLAGPYHFARPDIIESTQNSGGVANTGVDEADHFIEMAGAWMRPGYLLPVFDLEAGQAQHTRDELAQFSIDFSDRVYEVMGVRPVIYTNGNYANYLQGASPALQDEVVAAYPVLWAARWPNQDNPDAIPVQTGHPADTYGPIYGPWDDAPNPEHPWGFWQYASTGRLSGYNNGNSNLDLNVAQGGIEFLKDQLVPALWTGGETGEWTTLDNWNSGQAPIAPVQGRRQDPRVGPLTLPAVRLPAGDDTVVIDRDAGDLTVTHSSGAHSIRKLVVQQTLDITGGSLAVNHTPSSDSPGPSVAVTGALSVTGGALGAHTIAVDAGQQLTLAGELAFTSLQLAGARRTPGELSIVGDIVIGPHGSQEAVIQTAGDETADGRIDLGGQDYLWDVADGAAATDVRVLVEMINGSFAKSGLGTLALGQATAYAGDLDVQQGELLLDGLRLNDAANVALASGALLTLDWTGTPDAIGMLTLDGASMPAGVYGGVGSGAQFETPLLAGSGMLEVTAVQLVGDYNADGVVDAADYAVWRDNLGSEFILPNRDPASTGAVSQQDYVAWRNNFGATSASASSSAAPEPAALTGLAVMAAGITIARRRASRPAAF
ncbi:Lysozyme M1 precursor [Posidoniimonas corsicana]|uniref:Lysozyme M1 n=1 Tax=Posidoniimonas corsicana TaxID=1938618 RepID=A0A5C5VKG4_9BACT|nr:glycoside hydrolase family 25 protein [Posidoniimonas corsicana]TWT38202.1 Lysozyme M1 precursor [Posidoniimonas corsicana]